jgi:dipeptidyl aminopeptidase/acylaminoacyl peptidase
VCRYLVIFLLFIAQTSWAGYVVDQTEALSLGKIEGVGQLSNPVRSPGGQAIAFEILSSDGEALEVYEAKVENPLAYPPVLGEPVTVMPSKKVDVFSLGTPGERSISQHPSYGPATKRGSSIVMAATRREASRGGKQVNFDIYYARKGKRQFLTEHPDNDAEPAISSDGEYIAFTSGRTGEGDIYLYSFFSDAQPLTRVTFEDAGSELYPSWSADGERLAYIGHLGGADHLLVIDDVRKLTEQPSETERRALVRAQTRDLTAGWPHSCLAPSFSPDGKWIAFYMHPKGELRSDLYVVKVDGGEPMLLKENVLPSSRLGPCWSPDSDGVFVVEENAQLMNPVVWVSLDPTEPHMRLATSTQLNNDLSAWKSGSTTYLLFAAQGGTGDEQKRWRKIFVSRLAKGK